MKIYKFISFCVVFFAMTNVYAVDPNHVGDYKYWSVYKAQDGTKYMVSYPVADEGNFAKRERPYFMITNFNGNIESSVYVGYYYKKDSNPKISVYGKDSAKADKIYDFSFYTKNDMAWNKDADEDVAFVNTMKTGNKMIVFSESTKNTSSKDTYSLDGFSAAYNEVIKQ